MPRGFSPPEHPGFPPTVSVGIVDQSRRTLAGCVLLSGALGTVHAWSLFLEPLEAGLASSRGGVSAVYSVALVAITGSVLVGHRLFARLPGRAVALLSTGIASVGLVIASGASSLAVLFVGYGLMFGMGNGLGYAFALQRSAEARSSTSGQAMALVTASYALGAAIAGVVLADPVHDFGAGRGLRMLAIAVVLMGAVASALVDGGRSPRSRDRSVPSPAPAFTGLLRLWVGYGLAVLAGLTALGHAAALVDEAGGPGDVAVTLANFASAAGGLLMVATLDRTGHRRLVVGLPLATAVLLTVGAAFSRTNAISLIVPAVALAYGAIIAVYPAVVRDRYGSDGYPAAYGRVFTAWGAAGLIGPLGTGLLFDAFGDYRLPLLLAAVAAVASALVARSERL